MKIRNFTVLLLACMMLWALCGCTVGRVGADAVLQTVGTPTPTGATGVNLTVKEAETATLDHAGFTADQVQYLHTEYELDDGVPQYEVSFHQGRWEYDYEIDARTGEILSYDRDD